MRSNRVGAITVVGRGAEYEGLPTFPRRSDVFIVPAEKQFASMKAVCREAQGFGPAGRGIRF